MTLPTETVFVMENSPIKFGLGAMDEIGFDASRLGIRKALIFTDRHVSELGLPARVRALLEEQGVKADVWDGVEVEPTDRSMEEAGEYARSKDFDGLIAVGGGSTIDTCKAANLLTCYPAPLLDYINKPVGKGVPVPGPMRPLIAVPTTAGTGSETTAVAVTHIVDQNVKAGVSHRLLRPALGVVDPLNTLTVPPEVTAAAGADILTHAIESYTTRPYNARAKHHPPDRPAYIGANPASDIWCEKAMEYAARYLRRAVLNGLDLEARLHLALADFLIDHPDGLVRAGREDVIRVVLAATGFRGRPVVVGAAGEELMVRPVQREADEQQGDSPAEHFAGEPLEPARRLRSGRLRRDELL